MNFTRFGVTMKQSIKETSILSWMSMRVRVCVYVRIYVYTYTGLARSGFRTFPGTRSRLIRNYFHGPWMLDAIRLHLKA